MKTISLSSLIALCLGTSIIITLQPVKALPLEKPNQISQSNLNATQNFYDQGVEKAKEKDFTGAIEDFDQAISLNPNYTEAYLERGTVYAKLGFSPRVSSRRQKPVQY